MFLLDSPPPHITIMTVKSNLGDLNQNIIVNCIHPCDSNKPPSARRLGNIDYLDQSVLAQNQSMFACSPAPKRKWFPSLRFYDRIDCSLRTRNIYKSTHG